MRENEKKRKTKRGEQSAGERKVNVYLSVCMRVCVSKCLFVSQTHTIPAAVALIEWLCRHSVFFFFFPTK